VRFDLVHTPVRIVGHDDRSHDRGDKARKHDGRGDESDRATPGPHEHSHSDRNDGEVD
jgi:hypothetical protein